MNQPTKTQFLKVLGLGLLVSLTGTLVELPFLFLSIFLILYIARLLLHLGQLDEYVATNHDQPLLFMDIIDTLYSRIFTGRRKVTLEIQALNERLTRNEKWLNQLRDAVMVIDEYDHIIRLNKRCQRLFNIEQNHSLDFSVYSLIRIPKFTQYLTKGNYMQPLKLKLNSNPPKYLEITITAFTSERLLLLRDITEQQLVNQVKQDFIANLSHELRTPMTVIQGYTETLPLIIDGENPQLAPIIDSMSAQVTHLNQLVEDLSDLVAIESAPIHSSNTIVNVPQLINQQMASSKMLKYYRQQQISAEVEEQLGLKGNPKEITSIITNLVSNAIKYTDDSDTIKITWKSDERQLWLMVEDSGVGIESEHISRLTERFYRVDNSRTSTITDTDNSLSSGTGLGLAIVKHALINHQATLNINSEPGKGSQFICEFPIERRALLNTT